MGYGFGMILSNFFIFDSLSLLMVSLIAVIFAVVFAFSKTYMDGDTRKGSFIKTLCALAASVSVMVISNHVVILGIAWLITGILLSLLIAHYKLWPKAQTAGKLALGYFLTGSAFLVAGLGILSWQSQTLLITEILAALPDFNIEWTVAGTLCLIFAAVIQSALFPFHHWLMASMTAPTPVSAFMHAGIVNAGGFLIIRFLPLFTALPDLLFILFVFGIASAFFGSLIMMVQNDVKRALGASTVAQMGFMIMQCGLGFFTAAIAHLILHAFFKAYHFLAAGSALENPELPGNETGSKKSVTLACALAGALAAAAVFMFATGKTLFPVDTGVILILFAGFAGYQAGMGLARLPDHVLTFSKIALSFILPGICAGIYGCIFVGLNTLMPVNVPQTLSFLHIGAVFMFGIFWLVCISGIHRNFVWLYMQCRNASTPPLGTVLDRRSAYNDQ